MIAGTSPVCRCRKALIAAIGTPATFVPFGRIDIGSRYQTEACMSAGAPFWWRSDTNTNGSPSAGAAAVADGGKGAIASAKATMSVRCMALLDLDPRPRQDIREAARK